MAFLWAPGHWSHKPATVLFLVGRGRSEVRVRVVGKWRMPPCRSTRGQFHRQSQKTSEFLHRIVSNILQAAEWVLRTTWGLCWGGSWPPAPPFLPSSHICYYNNKGQWRVFEVKLGDDLGSWLLLVLSIVTPTMSLWRRAPQVLMMG